MVCCAVKKNGGPIKGELAVRVGYHRALDTSEKVLRVFAPFSRSAALWRDFAAMMADTERRDLECLSGEPEGTVRLRRALAGRLLRVRPRAAGRVHRRLSRARPGPYTDLVAGWIAGVLEDDATL